MMKMENPLLVLLTPIVPDIKIPFLTIIMIVLFIAKSQDSAMHYYYKADSLLIADAALIPIYYGNNIRLIQNNVHALPINNMEYRDFTSLFFQKNDFNTRVFKKILFCSLRLTFWFRFCANIVKTAMNFKHFFPIY